MTRSLYDRTPALVGVDGSPTPVLIAAGTSVVLVPALEGRLGVAIVNLHDDRDADPLWLDFGQGPTLPIWARGSFGLEYVGGEIEVHNLSIVDKYATYQGFASGATS